MESVEFAGYDRILYKLTSLYDLKGVENGIEKGCVLVERDAKKKAPKDTGTLRRSITSEVKAGNTDVEGSVFTPLEYAPYVEYGTGLFARTKRAFKALELSRRRRQLAHNKRPAPSALFASSPK